MATLDVFFPCNVRTWTHFLKRKKPLYLAHLFFFFFFPFVCRSQKFAEKNALAFSRNCLALNWSEEHSSMRSKITIQQLPWDQYLGLIFQTSSLFLDETLDDECSSSLNALDVVLHTLVRNPFTSREKITPVHLNDRLQWGDD